MPVKSTLVAVLLILSTATARADTSGEEVAQAARAAEAAADAAKQAAEAAKAAAQAVESLANHVAAKEQITPMAPPELPPWSFVLGVSYLGTYGNASASTAQLKAGAFGHWGDWGTELKLTAGYGETHPRDNQPSEVTAQNAALTARGTHNFTSTIGMYVYGGVATDRVASIETQSFGEAGMAVIWWEVNREDYVQSTLRTSVGARGMYESHHQYFPPLGQGVAPLTASTIYGPTLSINWRYALTKLTVFTEDADFLIDVNKEKDFRANSATALTVSLKDGLALQVALGVRYIGAPQPGKLPTDTTLSAGLNWTW